MRNKYSKSWAGHNVDQKTNQNLKARLTRVNRIAEMTFVAILAIASGICIIHFLWQHHG